VVKTVRFDILTITIILVSMAERGVLIEGREFDISLLRKYNKRKETQGEVESEHCKYAMTATDIKRKTHN